MQTLYIYIYKGIKKACLNSCLPFLQPLKKSKFSCSITNFRCVNFKISLTNFSVHEVCYFHGEMVNTTANFRQVHFKKRKRNTDLTTT